MQIPTRCRVLLIVFVLLPVPTGLLFAQPGGGGPAPVHVSRVITTHQASSKSFIGSLVPLKRSLIGSAVDGRVTQIFVEEGDAVTVDPQSIVDGEPLGQPLLQLRTVSLNIEIEAATIELRLREQEESELQASLPTEIEGAKSAVEEIKARLKFSKTNMERMQNLLETGGGVSKNEVDEAFSTFLSQTQLNAGTEMLLKKLIATKESRLQQARGKVEAQQVEIRRLEELKNNYTIRAPFDGYVTAKNTELGQWVTRGETVLEVVQLDPIELVVPVPQTYIQALHEALKNRRAQGEKLIAQVRVDAIPGLLEGEVIRTVPQADLRSRSFPVIIRIQNPTIPTGHLLKAGMLARASLFLGNIADVLLVHKDALVLGGLETSLYVVTKHQESSETSARLVPVQVGASIGQWIQVIGDVQPGDQVVVMGNERLQPGQPIMVSKELRIELPDVMSVSKPSNNE